MKKEKVIIVPSGNGYRVHYNLDVSDVIDTKVYDMSRSGMYPQMLPCSMREEAGVRIFEYMVDDMKPLSEIIKYEMNKKEMLTIVYNVLDALESFGKGMISLSYVSKSVQHIFASKETGEVRLVVVPVDKETTDLNEVRCLIKSIIVDARYSEMDGDNYVARLINYANMSGTFSSSDMKKNVEDMLLEIGINVENLRRTPAMQTPQMGGNSHILRGDAPAAKVNRLDVMRNNARMNGQAYGPNGMPPMGPNGMPPVGPNGMPMGPNGMPPVRPNGMPPMGPNGMPMGPNGMPQMRPNGMPPMGPNGMPPVGPNGMPVGPNGMPMGPNGMPPVGPNGMPMGPNGMPMGPNGMPMGPNGMPPVGPNGMPMGPNGMPPMGPNGMPMGPNGMPPMGPNGMPMGPNGMPPVGPNSIQPMDQRTVVADGQNPVQSETTDDNPLTDNAIIDAEPATDDIPSDTEPAINEIPTSSASTGDYAPAAEPVSEDALVADQASQTEDSDFYMDLPDDATPIQDSNPSAEESATEDNSAKEDEPAAEADAAEDDDFYMDLPSDAAPISDSNPVAKEPVAEDNSIKESEPAGEDNSAPITDDKSSEPQINVPPMGQSSMVGNPFSAGFIPPMGNPFSAGIAPGASVAPPMPGEQSGPIIPPMPDKPAGPIIPPMPDKPAGPVIPPMPDKPAGPVIPPMPDKPAGPVIPPMPDKPAGPIIPPMPDKPAGPVIPPMPDKPAGPVIPPMQDKPAGAVAPGMGDRPTPHLVRTRTGEKIYIDKAEFKLGHKATDVDYIVTDNTAISRVHCIITKKNGVCYLKDNHSTNGTFINGQRLNEGEEKPLFNNVSVILGNEEFIYHVI